MKAASVSRFLGLSNKGMGSKAYNPRPIPVQLPFDGHGGGRQIVIGIGDAVIGALLADMARAGTQPPCRSLRIDLLALDKMRMMSSFISHLRGPIELAMRMTEFSPGASKAKGTGSRSLTRPYAPWR